MKLLNLKLKLINLYFNFSEYPKRTHNIIKDRKKSKDHQDYAIYKIHIHNLTSAGQIQGLLSQSEKVDLKSANKLPGTAYLYVHPEVTRYFEYYMKVEAKLHFTKTFQPQKQPFNQKSSK